MHAYKDAIRRTGGAYILYPGNKESRFKGFHELIPGLGAFSLNPNNENKDVLSLSSFIDEVIDHLINNASQRENIASKTYTIHKNNTPNIINEPIPEYVNGQKLIPDETYVLVGFYNTQEQYNWIKKGKYNFRIGSGNGSLILDKETVSASFILLHTHGDKSSGDIWKITSKGPKVYSKENLIKKGYTNPQQDFYFVIDIEKVDKTEFNNYEWEFKNLKNYNSGHASAKPFTASLTELLSVKKK